ncbi:MAG: activator of prop osmoprotectant transporter [Legionella sp.]|nr:MAG: activator of prop osmoprotectant transporter [Legionella sp.]
MRKQELHPRTAVINKTQKNQSKKARSHALLWLAAKFPLAFDNSLRIHPLKIGIMDDIMHYADEAAEQGISKSKLREAVVVFTRRLDYLTCLKAREMRVDLQGNEVSQVSEVEAEDASTKIKKRIEKSIRNAHKGLEKTTTKPTSNNFMTKVSQSATANSEDYLPTYPARAPLASVHNESTPSKTPAITIKTKSTRTFDPDAVARLKEKLGISRNVEDKKETTE